MNRVVLTHSDRALINSHTPERKGVVSFSENQRRFDDQTLRNSANFFGNFWRIFLEALQQHDKSLSELRNKVAVDQVLVQQDIEHAVE